MDFINKIGEKAGSAFATVKNSDVTKKAVNYASIPALSVQVGKQESEIKHQYEIIGAAVFAAQSENEESEFLEQFAVIKEAQKKIDELKQQIEEKKASGQADVTTKICPGCGKELEEEAAFCSKCGFKFEEEAEEAVESTAVEVVDETKDAE